MASKKGIDNPYGKLTDYPEPDSFEFDPTKLSPEEQEQLLRDSVDIDDPFEGKKLTDLDEPEKGMRSKSKSTGMTKKAAEKGMTKAAKGVTTPYGMTQRQIAKLSPGQYRQIQAMATREGAMRVPPSAVQRGAQVLRQFAGDAANMAARVPGASAAGRLVSRAAGPAGLAIAAHDIYKGVQDPNFMTGLISLFGGEEAAYNAWAAQQAEEGVEMPSYEEYLAQAEAMEEEGGMPDTREVAKRALAPRYEQEMGPEDME